MNTDTIMKARQFYNFGVVFAGDDQVHAADSEEFLQQMAEIAKELGVPTTGGRAHPASQLSKVTFLAGRVVRTTNGPILTPDLIRWIGSQAYKLNPTIGLQEWKNAVFTGWQYLKDVPVFKQFIEHMGKTAQLCSRKELEAVDKDWRFKPQKFAAGVFTPNLQTRQDMATAYCQGSLTQLKQLEQELHDLLSQHKGATIFRSDRLDRALGLSRDSI